ncbi:UDP-N-acetyl glucosamine 2-epimerase [Streptomyces boluensis]|uniref:Translation initiation factor 2 n=1 Tax=Streptomyces boluensis TaxID=1775135 RepID=A0A964UUK2_9ACTN|nr:UDP-N-acetyl glucosamine 2-epimerase [Streptomyces boluensis]NBE51915.1 hypothetical protein [Streptomyces boluensis]
MLGSQPLRVPVGVDAQRWSTFHGERTIVAAARTVTSTVRILETVPALLRDDPRITLVFAYDPTSAFNNGVLDVLHDAGCRVMPWEQLARHEPDLIVSASENVDVPDGQCPVLVLPHGVGFQKHVPDSRSSATRLSGMVPDALLDSGRAWLAVSHPDQADQLIAHRPKAAGRTLLVGDPCFDELLISRPRKETYRRALGVPEGHRLVVVSSTWGRTSLLGRHTDLPTRLLAELPYDEYRVAAVVHPNVWSAHGPAEVRRLLASALDSGLILLPPVHTWRAGLVAADLVVGDHGSVTLYGAALGKPVLLAAFGDDAVAGTAASTLREHAPRLDLGAGLRRQLEQAAEDKEQATEPAGEAVARRAFSDTGRSWSRLRSSLYRLVRLDEPVRSAAPLRALAQPRLTLPEVTSWTVSSTAWSDAGRSHVSVCRYPAVAAGSVAPGVEAGEAPEAAPYVHLACRADERDRRLAESASVLLREESSPSGELAAHWLRDTLTSYPGCSLAATYVANRATTWVGLRQEQEQGQGQVIEVVIPAEGPSTSAALAAAVVYTSLRSGDLRLDGPASKVTLHVGSDRRTEVSLSAAPSAEHPSQP